MNSVFPKARRRLASLAVLLAASSLTTCRIDDLLTPGELGVLAATPTELADSALAGSTQVRQYNVALRVDGTGEGIRYGVNAELGSTWIILGPATGTAPGTYSLSVNPTGLAVGEYVDTLRFTAEGPDAKQLRVPVRFKLLPCALTDLGALPAAAAGALGTADCASPRFTDRFARRYRITAQANDSVSVLLGSAAFGPSVAIERVGTPAPIATANSCAIATASACLRYVRLATAGDYIIEATSTGARATGAFTLAVERPRPPAAPATLTQLSVDAPVTSIAVGASIATTQITLQGALSDPDLDSLRFQVELRPVGSAYTGNATHVSALGTGTLSVLATGLTDGTAYKWRARAVDGTGRASAWTEFGGNATDASDVSIAVPDAPASPSGLAQRKDDGVTGIALGGVTDEPVVRLGATVTDNDPTDQIRLEVEIRPVGTALTNTATASSAPVASGAFVAVPVSGLSDDVAYRWQVRAVDQTGRASAWVRFGPSGETFRVALPPSQLSFVVEPSTTAAGAAIAPAVQIAARDAAGATLTSFTGAVTVALGDNPGAATLSGTRTVNAVAGVATFNDLRLDRTGTGYTLVATARAGAITTESDPFSVGAATARTLAFTVSPTAAVAGATIAPAITVIARDEFGNVATGFTGTVSLALAGNGAGATLLGATTVAAVNGVASFSGVRIERAAAALALVASASGFADVTTATFDVAPAAATTLRLISPPPSTAAAGAALSQQPVLVVEDAFGNRVRNAGTAVTATIASGSGASLTNTLATTDANGVATFTGLAITGPSGAYALAFASTGLIGVGSGTITLGAGSAARLVLAVPPSSSVANGAVFASGPAVRLEDAAGNPATQAGVAISVAVATGAPALSGTTTVLTDVSGVATFTDLAITGATGVRTLSFTATGLTGITSGTITVSAGAAFDMTRVAGDGQSVVAGSAVAVAPSVRVRDASQNPVPSVAVAFAVTRGGGSVLPLGTVTTDATGLATLTSWTLGASAGVNTVEASVAGLVGSPVSFTATGTAGSATQLSISGGNNLTGPVGSTLGTAHEVRVTDANGNPVAGVSVAWAVVGGGSVAPPTSITGSDGRATAVRTLGAVAGAQATTASATLAGGPASVTFSVSATVGGASQMSLSAGDVQADTVGATLATPLAVLVRDALNNPVPGVLISWTVLDGGGSITPATSTTNASGIATASWTLGTTTTSTDSTQLARASGVGSPVNFVATSRPGAVSAAQTTVAVAPASIAASRDTPATVTVTARDRFGNAIRGRAVTLSASGVGNTIVQPAAVTSATGITTGAIGATATGVRTIAANVGGLAITQQPALTVVAAPAAALLFTNVPATAIAGASLVPAPEVGVVDSLGNRNFTFSGAVTLGLAVNPAAGTLAGTLTRNAVAGVASFPGLALDRAANGYVLVATATGLAGATSGTIDVRAGAISAARSTVVTSTSSIIAGRDTATITVTARDANDNPVAGATVTLAASGATSALAQPLAVTNAAGVTTGRITATASGVRTISAIIGAVAVTQTTAVTVAPASVSGAVSTLTALPTTISAGGPTSTITVTARDAFGNVIPGATIVLASTGTGNTIVQPALTVANGQAAGTLASTAAGTRTVTATANGVALTASVGVVVTPGAISGSVSTLSIAPDTIIAGGGASIVTVTARDANGNPIAGATVLLAATGSGNTVTQPTAVTNASGVATGSVASTTSGSKSISATIGGTPVTPTSTLVVRPGAVSTTLSTLSVDATTTSAGAAPIMITATARDAQGNAIPGLAVVLAATGTGNTLTQPVAVTNASGVATGAIASVDAGVKTISATISGTALAQTVGLTVTAGAISAAQSSLVAAPRALTTDGGASTITVTARDASGNAIAGLGVVLSATGTGNTLVQPSVVTSVNGVATGTLSATVAGARIITATIGGVAIVQTDTVTVSPGAIAAGVSTVTVSPDTISADGGASTITVTARDANGNAVAGQSVSLSATGTGNTLTQPVGVTGANGVATGSLASTGAGLKIVSVTIGGTSLTATDTIVVRPGAVSGALSTIVLSTPTIAAAVGSTTVTVTAHDANGNVVPGVAVLLAATGTGNTVTQPVAVTDGNGVAVGSFASTVSETKTISATAGGTALVATRALTVVPDAVSAAQSTVSVAPASISADGAAATITVTARDANGNLVAGVSVGLTASGTGNTVVQPVATTGANGIATGTISSAVVGVKTISATVNGVAVTQTASLTVTPGTVSATLSTVGAAPPSITASGTGSTISITARDQHGNAVPGVAVTIAATGAGNTLTQPAAVTDAGGVATATIASTASGDKIVSAIIAGVAVTPTATVTVVPGAVSAGQSTVTADPASLSADGGLSTVTVTARDANGNLIPGATVVLAASGAGNTLSQPAAITNASGVATGTLASIASGAKVVSATIAGVAITQTATVTVAAGAISAAQSSVDAAPATLTAGAGSSTVTITARDANGNTVAGANASFAASGAGNTLTQPAVTGANGVASGAFESTGAGLKEIVATIGGVVVTQRDSVNVSAAAVSATLSTISAAPDAISSDGASSTITVSARDAFGNAVSGAPVTVAVSGSGNTLTQPTAVTDANGFATGSVSSSITGQKIVSATIAGVAIAQSATITVTAGSVSAALSTVVAAQPTMIAGGVATTITVTARDASGNAVPGATVTLASSGIGATLTQPAAVTDANGVATGSITSTVTGARIVSAAADGTALTQTVTVTVTPAAVSAATSSATAAPVLIAADGSASTIVVTARDQYANVVPGTTVLLAATGTGNTVTQPTAVTDANGVASGTVSSTAAGTKTISATIDGLAVTQTASVTVTFAAVSAATSTVLAAPASISADGGASTITITARDANGNPVAGATVTFVASGTGNTLTQPVGVTGADGATTGSVSSIGAGTKTITATITATSGVTPVTQTADVAVTAGAVSAAQSTVVAAPTSLVAGVGASTITVTARDQHGNPVPGVSVTLSANGVNTLTQPVGVTNASGEIIGTLASNEAGVKIVTASIDDNDITQTATITVSAGAVSAATTTVAVDPAALTAGAGSSAITVTARDASGNPISGATVVLAATGTGNTLVQPATVTGANGVATGSLSATTVGAKVVSATVNGVAITQQPTITVTAGAVDAATTTVVTDSTTLTAGNGSSAITVTARDASGNPIAGATVVLAATGTGNTLVQPVGGVTDANGVASGMISSTVAQAKSISATVAGTAITQTASLTVGPAALSDTASRVVASVADFTAGGSASVTVTARDAFGNPIAGLPVTFVISGSGNVLTQPAATTDANGQASGSFSSTGAGLKIITATINGTPITHTDSVTVTAGAVSAATSTLGAAPGTITAAGAGSTLTATVRDADSNPIAGATVTFAATGTGNTLTTTTVLTDANGVATTVLTSTIAGTKIVSAAVGATLFTQTATVVVTAGAVSAATTTVDASPTPITAGSGSSTISVTARDANGNVLENATVVLGQTGAGTLTQPIGNTNASGVTTGDFASTVTGSTTISATVNGIPITATAVITVTPAAVSAATSTVSIAPSTIAWGGSSTVTVTARDAFGNLIEGLAVTIASTGTDAVVTQPVGITAANGEATGAVSATVAGVKTVSASIAGTAVTQTQTLTVTAGAVSAANSTVTAAPTSISVVGGSSTITVTARDAAGNPIAGATVVITVSGLSNTVSAPAPTDANGVTTATLESPVVGDKEISVTINSVAIDDTATVTVTLGELSTTASSASSMTSRQPRASIPGVLDSSARLAPNHSLFSLASAARRRPSA